MRNLILSTTGLSILTNLARKLNAGFSPYAFSNLKENEFKAEDLEKVNEFLANVEKYIEEIGKNFEELKKLSAELNALLNFYKNEFKTDDIHILLHTDTYLGRKTADFVEKILREILGFKQVIKLTATDLRTKDLEEFRFALTQLSKELAETLISYKNQKYKIIFNLTGGFKSINSYLQELAPLYADKSIYIFETANELLVIPKIPVKLDYEIFDKYFRLFRALELNLVSEEKIKKYDIDIEVNDIQKIPESLILEVDGEYSLSYFGEMLFRLFKEEFYKEELYRPLSKRLKYSKNFERQFRDLDKNKRYQLNKTLEELDAILLGIGENLKSIRFKNFVGKEKEYQVYPFDGNDSTRLRLIKEGNVYTVNELKAHVK